VVIGHETTAAARWTSLFIVRAFVNDTITVAVWTGLHLPLHSSPCQRKGGIIKGHFGAELPDHDYAGAPCCAVVSVACSRRDAGALAPMVTTRCARALAMVKGRRCRCAPPAVEAMVTTTQAAAQQQHAMSATGSAA
jgi:hypothetical protein